MATDHFLRTWPYDPYGMIAWTAGAMQFPLLASIAWWDTLRHAEAAHRRHVGSAEPAHEMIVPQPIEDEGEHALFA